MSNRNTRSDPIAMLEDQPVQNVKGGSTEPVPSDLALVEVAFKGNRRARYGNTLGLAVEVGEHVIVEAERGIDLGRVVRYGDQIPRDPLRVDAFNDERRKIVRCATEEDVLNRVEQRAKEDDAFLDFQRRICARRLAMKPVDVEWQFDGKKVRFYFTAEHRVDFRALVRDLAGVHRTRIELRQIGVRDEARRLGGLTPCGRPLCCTTFLTDFAPITSQIARDQNLSLNPSKLSGLCGRLKCCLRFEHTFYQEMSSRFPRLGLEVIYGGQQAHVTKHDYLHEKVVLQLDSGERVSLTPDDVKSLPDSDGGLPLVQDESP